MKKGASTTIVMILVMLITVSLILMSYQWLLRYSPQTQEELENSLQQKEDCLKIESIDVNNKMITVRNCGDRDLGNFIIYLDSEPIATYSGTLNSGGITQISYSQSISLGDHEIFVSSNYVESPKIIFNIPPSITMPQWSSPATNNTLAGKPTLFSLYWTDDIRLSAYVFQFCNGTWTGVSCNAGWSNITSKLFTGTGNWSNASTVINSTVGATIAWCVYANDTSNNWNGTSCSSPFTFPTTATPDLTPPTYSNLWQNVNNNTVVGPIIISLVAQWSDNVGLNTYVNSSNVSGSWSNGTWSSFATGNWSNFTIDTTSITAGKVFQFRIYASDTSNNLNVTGIWQYTKDGTPPTYSLNSTNSTAAGKPIKFNIYWTDNVEVDNALTSLWNGSSWVNASSWCSIGASNGWCNQTMVVNSTPQQLWWKVYANDTSNNWNTSQNFSLKTSVPCDFYIFQSNMTNTYSVTQSNNIYCLAENIQINSKNAINFSSGVQNTVLNCQGYTIDGNDTSNTYGIYLSDSTTKNDFIKNCTITDFSRGINIIASSTNITIINVTTKSNTVSGIYLSPSNYSSLYNITSVNNTDDGITIINSFYNKVEDVYLYNFQSDSDGIFYIQGSGYLNITKVNIVSNLAAGFYLKNTNNSIIEDSYVRNCSKGVYINSCFNNSITADSIYNNTYDYYLYSAGTNNNFTDTNFTSSRNIYFYDTTSWFNYNNETTGGIWLKTNVSAQSAITRKLLNWSQTLIRWNDTFSNTTGSIIARYNIIGLLTNTNYTVYNTSVQIGGSPFNSSSAGQISFTIYLPANSERNITVQKV